MDYEWSIRSGAEKVWNETKARCDLTFKSFLGRFLGTSSVPEKGGYRHYAPLAGAKKRIGGVCNVGGPVRRSLSNIAHSEVAKLELNNFAPSVVYTNGVPPMNAEIKGTIREKVTQSKSNLSE
jgi:hypothetical protein